MYECLPVFMYVHYVHAYYLWSPEEGIRLPRTGVTVDCQQPCGCCELKHSAIEVRALGH